VTQDPAGVAPGLRVAVIGAGLSGILAAIRLREAGHSNVVVYEKSQHLGGTWRDNTYPGIACDVPSHVYSFSFAPNPNWSQKFAPGGEILAYLERVARDFGVMPFVRFDEAVCSLTFSGGRWEISTSKGRNDWADVVIAATGVLHHPKIAPIEGLDALDGRWFHSAQWDHDAPLDGRKIGVIGTGSTAVQIVSALGRRAARLSVFQRTPQWILPLDNKPYRKEEQAHFEAHGSALREVRDELSRRFGGGISDAVIDAESDLMRKIEESCRANLEKSVRDPVLREKLLPNYRPACKRLVFSSDFYDVIQRSNVGLVTESIAHAEAAGLRTADGVLHELDLLVLATGFHVDMFHRPIEVTGEHGVLLNDVWRERPSAYLAVSVSGFPNFFMLNGPTGPVGNFSLIEVSELQMAYVLQLVDGIARGEYRLASASPEAAARYDADRTEAARRTIWATGCRSWYLDDRGIPTAWPWTFAKFREAMNQPILDDFTLAG
jgi:cation diffusion facilitator CzcD-associated flavoprotein CzcO